MKFIFKELLIGYIAGFIIWTILDGIFSRPFEFIYTEKWFWVTGTAFISLLLSIISNRIRNRAWNATK